MNKYKTKAASALFAPSLNVQVEMTFGQGVTVLLISQYNVRLMSHLSSAKIEKVMDWMTPAAMRRIGRAILQTHLERKRRKKKDRKSSMVAVNPKIHEHIPPNCAAF